MIYLFALFGLFFLQPVYALIEDAPDEETIEEADPELPSTPLTTEEKRKNWIHTQNYEKQRHNIESLDHEWKSKTPRKGVKSLLKKGHNKSVNVTAGAVHHTIGGNFLPSVIRNRLKTKENPHDMIGATRKPYREKMVDKELTPESRDEMAAMRQKANVTPEQYYAAQKYKTANLTPQQRQAGREWMEDVGETTGKMVTAGPAIVIGQGVKAGASMVPGGSFAAGFATAGINKGLGFGGSVVGGYLGKKGFDHAINQHNAGYKSAKDGKKHAQDKALGKYTTLKNKVFGSKKQKADKPTVSERIGGIVDKGAGGTIKGVAGLHGASKGLIVNRVVQGEKRLTLEKKMRHEKKAEKSGDTFVEFVDTKEEINQQATTAHKLGKKAKSDRKKLRGNIQTAAKNDIKSRQKAANERLKAQQAEEAAQKPDATKSKKGLSKLFSRSKKTK